jgi:protease I
MNLLSDLTLGILAGDGVNHSDLTASREQMERAGVKVYVVSPRSGEVKAWDQDDWGIRFRVDMSIAEAAGADLDALLIPGGTLHADSLREDKAVTNFVQECYAAGKIIGAIGHGIQVLISAEIIRGRQVIASPSLKTDVVLAGGIWSSQQVVSDNGLVTCHSGQDAEQFNRILMEELRFGIHQRTETII